MTPTPAQQAVLDALAIEQKVSEWSDDALIKNSHDAAIAIRNREVVDMNEFGVGTLISELACRLSQYVLTKPEEDGK